MGSVGNSGNQPYTTTGLATTRTLSETSPPVIYSLEHYLFGPVACFNRNYLPGTSILGSTGAMVPRWTPFRTQSARVA